MSSNARDFTKFLVEDEARRQGVDPALATRVARQESGFNHRARSSKGARGVMQLMPGTAKELGVNPDDAVQNIQGGVRYLKQQKDAFGSDELAAAAYNAGPGAVRKAGNRVPNISETQNYVKNVAGQAKGDFTSFLESEFSAPRQPQVSSPTRLPRMRLATPGASASTASPYTHGPTSTQEQLTPVVAYEPRAKVFKNAFDRKIEQRDAPPPTDEQIYKRRLSQKDQRQVSVTSGKPVELKRPVARTPAQPVQEFTLGSVKNMPKAALGGLMEIGGDAVGLGARLTGSEMLGRIAYGDPNAVQTDMQGDPSAAYQGMIQTGRDIRGRAGEGLLQDLAYSAARLAPVFALQNPLAVGVESAAEAYGAGSTLPEAVKQGVETGIGVKAAGALGNRITTPGARGFIGRAGVYAGAPIAARSVIEGEAPELTPHDIAMGLGFSGLHSLGARNQQRQARNREIASQIQPPERLALPPARLEFETPQGTVQAGRPVDSSVGRFAVNETGQVTPVTVEPRARQFERISPDLQAQPLNRYQQRARSQYDRTESGVLPDGSSSTAPIDASRVSGNQAVAVETPKHHSHLQPRTEAGQFDGPPVKEQRGLTEAETQAANAARLPADMIAVEPDARASERGKAFVERPASNILTPTRDIQQAADAQRGIPREQFVAGSGVEQVREGLKSPTAQSRPPERGLTRNFRAGINNALMTFASDLQRDLYDWWANRSVNRQSGRNPKVQASSLSAIDARVKSAFGGDRDALVRAAIDTYNDVKTQMKGVKDGEARTLTHNIAAPERTVTIVKPSTSRSRRVNPDRDTLLTAIQKIGVKPNTPEGRDLGKYLQGREGGRPGTMSRDGLGVDELVSELRGHGFDVKDPNHLLELVRAEQGGKPTHSTEFDHYKAAEKEVEALEREHKADHDARSERGRLQAAFRDPELADAVHKLGTGEFTESDWNFFADKAKYSHGISDEAINSLREEAEGNRESRKQELAGEQLPEIAAQEGESKVGTEKRTTGEREGDVKRVASDIITPMNRPTKPGRVEQSKEGLPGKKAQPKAADIESYRNEDGTIHIRAAYNHPTQDYTIAGFGEAAERIKHEVETMRKGKGFVDEYGEPLTVDDAIAKANDIADLYDDGHSTIDRQAIEDYIRGKREDLPPETAKYNGVATFKVSSLDEWKNDYLPRLKQMGYDPNESDLRIWAVKGEELPTYVGERGESIVRANDALDITDQALDRKTSSSESSQTAKMPSTAQSPARLTTTEVTPAKGEHGSFINSLFKSPDIDAGKPAFLANNEVRAALGLKPFPEYIAGDKANSRARSAAMTETKDALAKALGQPRSSHIAPETLKAWAKENGLSDVAHESLDVAHAQYRAKEAAKAKLSEAIGPKPADHIVETASGEGEKNEPKLVSEARQRLRQDLSGNKLHSNPVRSFVDTAIITGYDTYKTAKEFGAWSKEMVTRMGEKIRPMLRDIYARMQYEHVTETPEFKRWADDKLLLNEVGPKMRKEYPYPHVLERYPTSRDAWWYHGTQRDIDVFKIRGVKRGTSDPISKLGIHLTQEPGTASQFAENYYNYAKSAEGGNVMPLFVKMGQPKAFAFESDLREAMSDFAARHNIKGPDRIAQAYVKDLQSQGYDGVIYGNTVEGIFGERTAIVFDPTQIKSAIGHRGAFDPKDPSLVGRDPEWREGLYKKAESGFGKVLDNLAEPKPLPAGFKPSERGFVRVGGERTRPSATPTAKEGRLFDTSPVQRRGARAKAIAIDLLNSPRSLKSSLDVSAPLRQGAIFSLTEPRASLRAGRDMFRALVANEGAYKKLQGEIEGHKDYRLAKDSGVEFTGMGEKLSRHEEAFMSRIAEKLPHVKYSEQAYVTFLNSQRMHVFSKYAKELSNAGIDASAKPKAYKDIARFVNAATGRGEIGGKLKDMAPMLNGVFFSPRYIASRVQVLNPVEYAKMEPAARKIAIRKIVQFAGTVGTTMGLAALAGAKVGMNPDDSDFGKVVVGNTRYDLTAGFNQYLRFAFQMSKAMAKTATGNKTKDDRSAGDIALRFMRGKLAPLPSSAVTLALVGKDFKGEPASVKRELLEQVTPMVASDFYEAIKGEGLMGAIKTTPGIFGVGVQTYRKQNGASSRRTTSTSPDAAIRRELNKARPERFMPRVP